MYWQRIWNRRAIIGYWMIVAGVAYAGLVLLTICLHG